MDKSQRNKHRVVTTLKQNRSTKQYTQTATSKHTIGNTEKNHIELNKQIDKQQQQQQQKLKLINQQKHTRYIQKSET